VLVSILLPAIARARRAAQLTQCMANLRSIAQLEFLYANANKDLIPLGYMGSGAGATRLCTIVHLKVAANRR